MTRKLFSSLLGGFVLMLGGQAAWATCTITPSHSVVNAGESVTLTATCTAPVTAINWTLDGAAATTPASLPYALPANTPFYLHTPPDLASDIHTYNVTVTPTDSASGVEVVIQSAGLTVATTGAGTGSISSSPAGISCGQTCKNSAFNNGAMVTLTATPAIGSTFTGWGGDCSGAAACTIVMSANRNVTASFDNAPVAGACGLANGTTLAAEPTTNECANGTTFVAGTPGTNIPWTCNGLNGGTPASCSATRLYTIAATAGAGGTISPASRDVASGGTTTFTVTPNNTYAATVTGCGGSLNGTMYTTGAITSGCSVSATFSNAPVAGVCGSAINSILSAEPTSNQCAQGNFVAGTPGANIPWTCTGVNNGATANCSATRSFTVSATAGANGSISPGTRTVNSGSTTTFAITPSSGFSASVTGCGGSLSGTTYTTGSVSADCAVSATFSVVSASTTDPGQWTGFWIPPGMSNVIVADSQSPLGAGTMNYVPGCLNQQVSSNQGAATDCSSKTSYSSTVYGTNSSATAILSGGNILSVRFMSNANPTAAYGSFLLQGGAGGNLGISTNMWLSTSPGVAMSSVPAKCQATSPTSARISTGSSTSYCNTITPNTLYYLNIQVPETCTFCSFKLTEDAQFN